MKELKDLEIECLSCKKCSIGQQKIDGHLSNVFSNMNFEAKIMIVGQNPGKEEIIQRTPFIGISGKIFDECLLEYAGLTRENLYICNAVCCLRYNTKVLLGNGTWENISTLVKEKYSGEVLCVSPEGILEKKRVINWYKNEKGKRKLFKISYNDAKKSRHGSVGPIVTEDHPILTKRGYVLASKIKNNDMIAVGDNYPNKHLEDLIIGSILGDAHINKKSSSFAEIHSAKQKDYLEFKSRCLKDFGTRFTEYRLYNRSFCRIETNSHRYFKKQREIFYGNKKKNISSLNSLSDFLVAIWYMDDGNLAKFKNRSPSMCFSTNGFTKEEVDYLCSLLSHFYGINDAKRIKSNGWRIRVGFVGTRIISERIAKFILPSMKYKLPIQFRDIPFEDTSSLCSANLCGWSEGTIREVNYSEKSVYCIDVEDNHNFITTGGVVVHNCFTPENRKPTESEFNACSELLTKQIETIKPKVVVTLGGVSLRALTGLNGITKYHAIPQFSTKYQVVVFPLLHPSPLNTNRPDKKAEFCLGIKKLREYLDAIQG